MARQSESSERPQSVAAIGRRLRLTREALGKTQAEFARTTGISANAWNNYEQGYRRISIDAAYKLARVTGVSFDWIYQGTEALLPSQIAREIEKRERAQTDERKRA